MLTSEPTPSSRSTTAAHRSVKPRSAPPAKIILVCCAGLPGSARNAVGPWTTAVISLADSSGTCSRQENISFGCPELMAHARDSARTYGKSDPIDALAVARAAQREPDLPVARLDGPDRELRLLVDHRESLVAERTRLICRLRWHLHEVDPAWEPKARSLDAQRTLDEVQARLQEQAGVVARLARELANRCAELTTVINAWEKEIAQLVEQLAAALLALPGCGPLTAAKIIGATAGVDRFKSGDAYARYNGTAPLPVWSSNKSRHRLSRTGNRQLNAVLHRIALTQARWHPPAKALIDRRKNSGNSGREAIRILKRRLSDAVFQALLHDQTDALMPAA
jgi:transposase